MTEANLYARALEAQKHWGGTGEPQLIGHRENAVFKAYARDGTPLALRLHRVGYQTQNYIEGELAWTQALAELGFPCPRPIQIEANRPIYQFEDGQLATAVSWIDAAPLADFSGSPSELQNVYFDVGKLLARLHRLTDRIDIPIARPSWDTDALLGKNPSWGRFWENPSLSDQEKALVLEMRTQAAGDLGRLEGLDFGLIHADAIKENVLTDGKLHLIDFDDSGYGYRLYDLGVTLVPYHNDPSLPELMGAICEGYGTPTDHIALFIMLRSMASAGWIISRAPKGSTLHRRYADRMLECVELYQNA